jgi:isopenicillin-N N-acyltransferase like protein
MATMASDRVLVLEGDAAERGRQHGEALRDEVRAALGRFGHDVETRTGMHVDRYVARFLADTSFGGAIHAHTPALAEEVAGIAAGADVPHDHLLAYNLLDEEWWYSETLRSKCSALAVPAREGGTSLVAQTMDLPRHLDGGQVLLRHREPGGRETAVLAAAGLLGLTGASSDGVGVCVNALGMLRHDGAGLPVAHALRGALQRPTAAAAAAFLRGVTHASGQHYSVVDASGDAYSLECSAGGAATAAAGDRAFFHANHPLASSDLHPGASGDLQVLESSRRRQAALEAGGAEVRSRADARRLLADRTAPICAARGDRSDWITFGAVATELGETVTMDVALGPTDETPWLEVELGR